MEALYKKHSGTVEVHIDSAAARLLEVPLPRWMVSEQIKLILSGDDAHGAAAYQKAVLERDLEVTPGMDGVLSSDSPPSLDFFKNLPKPSTLHHQWGVYAVVLERKDSRPKLYIGSGSNALNRIRARQRNYENEENIAPLSELTRKAIHEGYKIASFGMLCWMDLPAPHMVLRQRARILVLETVFAIVFRASRKTKIDVHLDDLFPWARESMEWDGICTHLSFIENVAHEINFTDEELTALSDARAARRREYQRAWVKRQLEENEEEYREKRRAVDAAWRDANRESFNETKAQYRAMVKEEKRYHCEICDVTCPTPYVLDKHNDGPRHAEAVKNGGKKELSEKAKRLKAASALVKASGIHSCPICVQPFTSDSHLRKHFATKKHKDKAGLSSSAPAM